MHLPTLLREARRSRGLSIRAAARRCDVPPTTWADWEAGKTAPPVTRLDEALRVLGLDLRLAPRPTDEPPGLPMVVRHLRRSLTQRARLALADQLPATLAACQSQPRLLTGPAAVGVWVPHVVARGPLPLPPAPTDPELVRLRIDAPKELAAWALVPPPAALLRDGLAQQWPLLAVSARLMAQGPRDAVGRKLPPHRDPDEMREARDLEMTLTWGGTGIVPVAATDSRAWRLDAPATLDAQLLRRGLPLRNTSRRPGQPL